ncbi:MAG: M28 family metallopeptidase [Acidobacteriota bacterium]
MSTGPLFSRRGAVGPSCRPARDLLGWPLATGHWQLCCSIFLLLIVTLLLGCNRAEVPTKETAAAPDNPPPQQDLKPALDSIQSADLMGHIGVLASDEYEGRGPGTKGEALTVKYLTEQFTKLGLKPGAPDGGYVQPVPLVGFRATPQASFTVAGQAMTLKSTDQYVAVSRRFIPQVDVEKSEVVFVGYGVVAPEYGWDDYKGVDVRGKTIVMLINDPAVPDPSDPARLSDAMFKGKAMTYYGRWTYKYEIASEKGAAAAIIVHETGPAGYPYEVIAGSWGRENFDIQRPDKNMGRVAVESWISLETAQRLFKLAGQDFEALKEAAQSKDFSPVPLGAQATFHLKNELREVKSANVVARLEGSDPKLRDEHVVYSAHWDHLGRDDKRKGDQIFNGAIDNASGIAGLLELAEAYTKLGRAPRRSILFLAVTAEEKGLLGAKYYAGNPLYPLARTVANVNMDGLNQWGRTRDVVVVGRGNSTLDDVLEEEARAQGRVIVADPEPEKGFFYRSDHFEFAKQGVPALYTDSGVEYIGKPEGYGKRKREEYTQNDYHKVSDDIKADWDLAGGVEDLHLLFAVGYRVSEEPRFPEWKPGTEFKDKREKMLKTLE